MLALVEQLKGFITGGETVYMHCWGGRGRAGTIASCFLASCYHLTADETADRIQLAFDTRKDGGKCTPTYTALVVAATQLVAGKQAWRMKWSAFMLA